MPRENSKCRKWEKDRRNRFNEAFLELAKAQKKSETVRNEHLSNLLRDAGISVPSVFGTTKPLNCKKYPWTRRISPEQAKVHQKREMEKENICSKGIPNKKRKPNSGNNASSKKQQTSIGDISKKIMPSKRRRNRKAAVPNCYIVLPQAVPLRASVGQQYYIVTNQPSNNVYKNIIRTGINNSDMFLKHFGITSKSGISKNIFKNNTNALNSLGAGTYILSDGSITRILPQCTRFESTPTVMINSTVGVVQQNTKSQSSKSNEMLTKNVPTSTHKCTTHFPPIKSKPFLTRTTQMNKVPIPALTSRYANTNILLTENSAKQNKIKKNEIDKEKKCCKIRFNIRINSKDETLGEKIYANSTNNKAEGSASVNSAENIQCENSIEKDESRKIVNSLKTETDTKKSDTVELPNDIPNKNTEILETVEKSTQVPVTVSTIIASAALSTTVTTTNLMKNLELNLPHSELSNDIFASLQVPSGCQNPESTSPTAAFLLAFPLVSSGVKVTEVIGDENSDSQRGTPTLLQIGTMETTKPSQSQTDTMTLHFSNLESFSFMPAKEFCNSYSTTAEKSNKIVSTSFLSTREDSNLTGNKSIYVDVKRPCLPDSATHLKETFNNCEARPANTSKAVNALENCKKNVGEADHSNFNSQNQAASKSNLNTVKYQKSFDQNSRCYNPVTYSGSSSNFSYRNDPTKFSSNTSRNYANPLYTNCSNYSYNYHPDSNFNQNYYKDIQRNETKPYYPLNYDSYSDCRKNDTSLTTPGYYDTSYTKESRNSSTKPKNPNQNKLPINWMTTPDNRIHNSECLLNSYSKGDFSQSYPFTSFVTTTTSSTYLNTSIETADTSCIMEPKKALDLPPPVPLSSHQRIEPEEKQFSWSPTKLPHFLDHPHNFISSTLPTLVGDLALPQLVDHNKPEPVPAKTATRSNSGSRSKTVVQQKLKKVNKQDNCGVGDNKICDRLANNYILSNAESFPEHKGSRNVSKNTSSSYSAEALIGNQVSDEAAHKKYQHPSSKSLGVSGFLTENIISYFPSVDLPQESYISQNQSYQSNNFTHNICSSQSNSYGANNFIYPPSTITSTYLSSNNFEVTAQDYLPESLISNVPARDKHFNVKQRQPQNKDDKNCHGTVYPNSLKKSKRKHASDTNTALPGFEFPSDLGTGAILPLPPISRCNTQHPEISPSMNSVGTSLTNFNLSTIFPEINKGHVANVYQDPRSKNNSHSKICTSAIPQVPFNTEPKFSFSM
ncbi:hypothetical protein NQ317_017301 [Molorchus minor]|uniref:Uncharacterized protein n=1 Tax=Molorchus minor TaxID=1323400 RepID=A0ABQ9JWL2_9CUCU|nr:hypothetical protein NQ317_017301 [Molorchus minor]